MKKTLYLLFCLLTFIMISCGDDTIPEQPPTEVSNINVNVIEGTTININWQASTDPNGDEIHYEILVNNRLIADKNTSTSINYDVITFLSRKKNKELMLKGVSLDLNIKIKAFDTNNNVSETVEINESVFVNRNPNDFEFNNVYFDFYSYNSIEISWVGATDPDGDVLSYDVYLNEKLIQEDYVIGTNSYNNIGYIYYNEGFYEYIDNEIIIKVIAKDSSGGIKEISRSYNFRDTDVNLGNISTPSTQDYSFNIDADEPDSRIGYSFTINNSTGFSARTTNGNELILRDENGNRINSSYQKLGQALLDSGTYYLEVSGYVSNANEIINFTFRDSGATDINYGVINSLPFNTNIELNDLNSEPDNRFLHSFEVTQEAAVSLTNSTGNLSVNIYDSNNNYIYSNNYSSNQFSAIISTPGVYYIEISGYSSGYDYTNQQISLSLQEVVESIVDLGVIGTGYNQEFNYDNTTSTNGRTRFNFTLNASTNITFEIISANHDTYLYLYDSNGNFISSDDDGGSGTLSKIISNLNAGDYYIETAGYGNSRGIGTLRITL